MDTIAAVIPMVVAAAAFVMLGVSVYRFAQRDARAEDLAEREREREREEKDGGADGPG